MAAPGCRPPARWSTPWRPVRPDCGAPLAGGSVKRTREVIDLSPPQIVVTEHVFLERRCPDRGQRCVPPPQLPGLVTGQGRIGHRLTSLLGVLREEARLPIRVIQRLLATLTGLHLSVGAITAVAARIAHHAMPTMTAIQAAIRASPVVHLDATGWREAGRNGYVWTASPPARRTSGSLSTGAGRKRWSTSCWETRLPGWW